MNDDLKLPQIGELTLPRWQYWLARYNGVLGERDRRIEKLEAALRVIVQVWDTDQPISIARAALARDAARKALEGKDD